MKRKVKKKYGRRNGGRKKYDVQKEERKEGGSVEKL